MSDKSTYASTPGGYQATNNPGGSQVCSPFVLQFNPSVLQGSYGTQQRGGGYQREDYAWNYVTPTGGQQQQGSQATQQQAPIKKRTDVSMYM